MTLLCIRAPYAFTKDPLFLALANTNTVVSEPDFEVVHKPSAIYDYSKGGRVVVSVFYGVYQQVEDNLLKPAFIHVKLWYAGK